MSKEAMLKAEMLNHELGQLQEQLRAIEEQLSELRGLQETVTEIVGNDESEILVPLAQGIFVKGRLGSTKELFVNVGQGVVSPKEPAAVKELLVRQEGYVLSIMKDTQGEFDEKLAQLQELEKEFL